MKKNFLILLLSMASIVNGHVLNVSSEKTSSEKVCKGHCLIERIWGDFQLAKSTKEKWDEQTPYDRTIKTCKSEMYKEDNKWIIEYFWTHVDGCPKCDNYIVLE